MNVHALTALDPAQVAAIAALKKVGGIATRSLAAGAGAAEQAAQREALSNLARLWNAVDAGVMPDLRRLDPSTGGLLDGIGDWITRRATSQHSSEWTTVDEALDIALTRLHDPQLQRQLAALDAAAGNALVQAAAARASHDVPGASAILAGAAHDQLQATAARVESLGNTTTGVVKRPHNRFALLLDVSASDRAAVTAVAGARHAERMLDDALIGVDELSEFAVTMREAKSRLRRLRHEARTFDDLIVTTDRIARIRAGLEPHRDNTLLTATVKLGFGLRDAPPLPGRPGGFFEGRRYPTAFRTWATEAAAPYREVARQVESFRAGATSDLDGITPQVDRLIQQLRTSRTGHVDAASTLMLG